MSEADILLVPYTYVINEKIMHQMKIDLRNAILIIDEGHNICQAAEDITSFKLEAKFLDVCDRELQLL